jgi:chromate transporter
MEMLAVGQLLPGPNICNVAVMVGYRFSGHGGAASALAGLVVAPFLVIVLIGALYAKYGQMQLAQQALTGMSAVAAGLVLAMGLKMLTGLPRRWRPLLFATLAFVCIGVFRLPLLPVLLALAPAAVALSWKQTR